jgi:hypothetical protein
MNKDRKTGLNLTTTPVSNYFAMSTLKRPRGTCAAATRSSLFLLVFANKTIPISAQSVDIVRWPALPSGDRPREGRAIAVRQVDVTRVTLSS